MACSVKKATNFHMKAVALVASTSIQQWAQSAHNLPLFINAAQAALTKNPKLSAQTWATNITLLAMG